MNPQSFSAAYIGDAFGLFGAPGIRLKRRKIDTSEDRRDLKASPSAAYRSDSRSGE